MERTGAPLPTAGSGVPGVSTSGALEHGSSNWCIFGVQWLNSNDMAQNGNCLLSPILLYSCDKCLHVWMRGCVSCVFHLCRTIYSFLKIMLVVDLHPTLNKFYLITPQTVMLGGIPRSINHDGVPKVASHAPMVDFPVYLGTCNDKHCDFTSMGEIWSRGMLRKVKYQCRIFRGDAGGNRQEMLGRNYFHPASSRYFRHWKLMYAYTSNVVVPPLTHLFPSVSIYTKTSQSHSPITVRSNSSLRTRGHVGCWVEFHPA